MQSWRAFHIYTSRVTPLILDCVTPFLEKRGAELENRSWERHYVGGSHLRLRLKGSEEALSSVGDELVAEVEAYLEANPSPDAEDYSPRRVANLLAQEKVSIEGLDLSYRNNVVEEHPYPAHQGVFHSDGAAQIMDDFRHDVLPLATAILRDPGPRWEIALRFFFLQALAVGGTLKNGSVSWRSHWEGFSASFSSTAVIDRVRESFVAQRDEIIRHLEEVETLHAEGRLDEDPFLGPWWQLVQDYGKRARHDLKEGVQFTVQPKDAEQAKEMRQQTQDLLRRQSEFVRTFWSSEKFLTAIQHEPRMQVPRILTNLLYSLLSMIEIKPIEKMALCHHSHRAVEDYYDCDLQEVLKENMRWMESRHADRWEEARG